LVTVFPSSLAVIAAGLILGLVALAAFAWAWRTGAFRQLDRQAHVILDERDLRLERPWESPRQQAERVAACGELLPPRPSEWGGAR
jgi:cbb3-type cytochrome oxidase maturation protein